MRAAARRLARRLSTAAAAPPPPSLDASLFAAVPPSVKIVEVGPRDGLQNERDIVPTQTKIRFINKLSQTGLSTIEATSFVSPKWVPQMADNHDVMTGIRRRDGVWYSVLTPNLKGLEAALEAGAREVSVFAAASEAFSRKNINCSVDESIARFVPLCDRAREEGLRVRGYVSCVVGCPYQGEVAPRDVARVAAQLRELGCYEISLGDTIGVGTPRAVARMLDEVRQSVPVDMLAAHFHDTYGQALVNILAAMQAGVAVVDSSVAGLGGCPYAKGASGNVATEDVLYMLQGMGVQTGVDMEKLVLASLYISAALGKQPVSRASVAITSKLNLRYDGRDDAGRPLYQH